MSFRKSSRRRPSLQLQTLEQRENPAGAITTALSGGVLTITGSSQGDEFTLLQTGSDVKLTGDNSTTVNGSANQTFAAVTSIKMVLKEGDDIVKLDTTSKLALTGSLTIDGGDGNNTVTLTTTATDGAASVISLKDFTYAGGDGTDDVTLGQAGATSATTVTGAVSLTTGDGATTASIINATVGGDLTVKSGVGSDDLTLDTVTASKNVSIDFGYGDGSLVATSSTITGGLSYKALDGNDSITLNTTAVNGKTGVTIAGGIGNADLTTSGAVAVPAGGVTLTGINGISTVSVNGGTLTVFGDLKVNNSGIIFANNGTTSGALKGIMASNVSLTGGDGITLAGTGDLNVKKNLTLAASSPVGTIISLGLGIATLNLDGNLMATSTQFQNIGIGAGLVKGSLNLTSKLGGITLQQSGGGNLEFIKGFSIKAPGLAQVQFDSSGKAKVGGDISLTSTTNTASFRNTAGELTLLGGLKTTGVTGGQIQFSSSSATGGTVAKDVSATASRGDVVVVPSAKNLTLSGKLTATGSVRAYMLGTLQGTINIAKDVAVTATYLDARIDLTGAGDLIVGGKLSLKGGSEARLSLANAGTASAVAGDTTVTAGRGVGQIQLSGGGKAFAGAVALTGYGANLIQNGTTTATTYAKNLTVTAGGATSNTVLMGGLYTVTGDAAFNFGNGSNAIILSSTTAATDFAGKLTVKTGNGLDTNTYVNVQVTKDVSVTTLGGGDVVYVDGGSVMGGLFTVDTGAGDDNIDFGHTTGLPVPAATFTGKVTVKTGAGNDKLLIGENNGAGGDANSKADFGTPGSTIDGGTGYNLYDVANGLDLASITNLAVANFVP